MKKGIGIVFMLTLVVVLFSLAVYLVEGPTTKRINELEQAAIEQALKEVYPEIEGSGYDVIEVTDVDFNSTVTAATAIKDGDVVKAVIYTVVFRGFSSDITYVVGVNAAGEITGYKTISQGDTAGFGAQIADSVNWLQFPGMLLDTAAAGAFDGLAGASITTGAWETSFANLLDFHNEEEIIPSLSAVQVAMGKAALIAPEGSTLTQLVPSGVKTLEEYEIDYAFVVNDGTSDIQVIYYDFFYGHQGDNEIVISFDLTTNNVVEFKALSSMDTEEPLYGYAIMEEDRWTQFVDKTPDQLVEGDFDGIAGSTNTTNGWKLSMQNISIFHQAEFEGKIVYTPEEQFVLYQQELLSSNVATDVITEVTNQKLTNMNVTNVYDVKDESGTYLGTLYYVNALGVYEDGPTFIQFLVGINASDELTGIQLVTTTASNLKEDGFFAVDYGVEIEGLDINGVVTLDEIDDNPITSTILQNTLEEVIRYHIEDYPVRAGSYDTELTDLEAAYPTAVSFNNIYGSFEFDEEIGNIYEALNGADEVIGYVYVGKYLGREGDIVYAVGFDIADAIQRVVIIETEETWNLADEFGTYNGSYGTDFLTNTWVDEFIGVDTTDYLTTPVDGVAGVSLSTGGLNGNYGLIESVLHIINYHNDNSVGGAS